MEQSSLPRLVSQGLARLGNASSSQAGCQLRARNDVIRLSASRWHTGKWSNLWTGFIWIGPCRLHCHSGHGDFELNVGRRTVACTMHLKTFQQLVTALIASRHLYQRLCTCLAQIRINEKYLMTLRSPLTLTVAIFQRWPDASHLIRYWRQLFATDESSHSTFCSARDCYQG